MTLLQALVLGIVQGVTEYLPVSSSAHLVLVPMALGWHFPEAETFVFDVLVQLGTLFGVVIYFWSDLVRIAQKVLIGLGQRKPLSDPDARLGWLIILATIPASVIGLLFKDEVAASFSSPRTTMAQLLLTGGFLVFAEFFGRFKRERVTTKDALYMGFAQALALLPGVSRSGSTIAAGVVTGLSRESAARFSFLMSIPVMIGAALVAGRDLATLQEPSKFIGPVVVGMIAAAISGYFVIRWFLHFVKNRSLLWFALYCFVVGGGGLLFYG